MKKTFRLTVVVCAAVLSLPSLACDKPAAKPDIPDAATVVTAQMVKANNEVKVYVKAMEDYLSCARLPRGQEKQELEALQSFAEDFNVVVRAFKAKSAG